MSDSTGSKGREKVSVHSCAVVAAERSKPSRSQWCQKRIGTETFSDADRRLQMCLYGKLIE